jgi:hypothetical protein
MAIPHWLSALAWFWLMASLVSALIVAVDEARHPQAMAVMNAVWPVTALYGGPFALWGYFAIGRPLAKDAMHSGHQPKSHQHQPPTLRQIALSASHCGAGCMLADTLGENLVSAFSWVLLGESLYAGYFVTLGLAWLFGVAFQYFSIKPMKQLPPGRAIIEAIRADTLSILFFQIGMYGWMAIVYFLPFSHPHLKPDSALFWFMEQVGMITGFLTTMPINRWLVQTGVKEAMGS